MPRWSPAPDAAPVCGEDGLRCVRYVERQLAAWEDWFGCDHRAVFPTVYRLLTRQTRLALEDDPSQFHDPAGLGFEARLDRRHDMLLAINAHVQQDMPHAVARAGLVLPDGRSRKPDHDHFNRILASAYRPIVQEVGRRYDPMVSDIEALPAVDDVGAQQLVAGWREGVWRNAESLVTTEGTWLHRASVAAIDANATAWAEALRSGEVPGRRELRDAHCAAATGQDTEPGPGAPPARVSD